MKTLSTVFAALLASAVALPMWVIVRERIPGGYLGILDNDPDALAENDVFWSGIELPFSARHVIDIDDRDENTIALAAQIPKRRWPGD